MRVVGGPIGPNARGELNIPPKGIFEKGFDGDNSIIIAAPLATRRKDRVGEGR